MISKKYCFSFHSYDQALDIIKECNKKKILPILYCQYYLINSLGINWLISLKEMLEKDFKNKKFKIFVDVKNNYGLFMDIIESKISFIKVNANKNMLKKLEEIAKINKVLINPEFSIVDLSKIKNANIKFKRIIR